MVLDWGLEMLGGVDETRKCICTYCRYVIGVPITRDHTMAAYSCGLINKSFWVARPGWHGVLTVSSRVGWADEEITKIERVWPGESSRSLSLSVQCAAGFEGERLIALELDLR